jgi:radical SAM superfamily enzyme YgiQ (UPF0313 family)
MDVSIDLYQKYRKLGRENLWTEETSFQWHDAAFTEEFLGKEKAAIEKRYIEPMTRAEKVLVGFSVSSPSVASSALMTRWIKAARPDATVVWGGEIFTEITDVKREIGRMFDSCGVDALVEGEGEATLLDALRHVEEGRGLETCRSLWVRGADGPVLTGRRPPVDLDTLPFADFSVFDMGLYGTTRATNHDLVLMASRGCVRSCTFCGHWLAWPGFRQMSGERIYAEIKHQRSVMPSLHHDDSQIKFYDLLINGDMPKLDKLAALLVDDPSPKLTWKEANAVVRPEMTRDMCRKLYEAGCRQLIIGLESGSQRVLDLMRKRQTIAQMKETLRNAHEAGLHVRGNFMFGYPGETEDDFRQTLDFLTEMWPYIYEVYPSYTMTHLDGVLEREARRYGVDGHQHFLYWESTDKTNTYPVRLERLSRFRELAKSLGANMINGMDVSWDAYVSFALAEYHKFKGESGEALRQYRRYFETDPSNDYVKDKIRELETAGAAR